VVEYLRVFCHVGFFFAHGEATPKFRNSEDPMTQLPSQDYRQSFSSDVACATITVLVPNQDAQIWLGDARTTQRGMTRIFHTPGLKQDGTYTIKASWINNGLTVDQQRRVQVQPGQSVVVDFRTTPGERLPAQTQPEYSERSNRTGGILVVDDEPVIRDLLQMCLQHDGFRVWTASNGEEALDHCCDHGEEIVVILLDVRMPRLDGPETLEGIREFNPELPVCFMTGDPGDYDPSDLLARGARHVFNKPFRLEEVVRVVRRLANESRGELQEIDTWADPRNLQIPFLGLEE
jgi:uncharacterized protein (TIGR03000 family)